MKQVDIFLKRFSNAEFYFIKQLVKHAQVNSKKIKKLDSLNYPNIQFFNGYYGVPQSKFKMDKKNTSKVNVVPVSVTQSVRAHPPLVGIFHTFVIKGDILRLII